MAHQYKKHSQRTHVLELPDTYVGSIETGDEPRWVYDADSQKMVHRPSSSTLASSNSLTRALSMPTTSIFAPP